MKNGFLIAISGKASSNDAVTPLLTLLGASPIHLVKYPASKGVYYFWNSISDEVWKIHKPSKLADILPLLKDPNMAGIEIESLVTDGGTEFVDLTAKK